MKKVTLKVQVQDFVAKVILVQDFYLPYNIVLFRCNKSRHGFYTTNTSRRPLNLRVVGKDGNPPAKYQ